MNAIENPVYCHLYCCHSHPPRKYHISKIELYNQNKHSQSTCIWLKNVFYLNPDPALSPRRPKQNREVQEYGNPEKCVYIKTGKEMKWSRKLRMRCLMNVSRIVRPNPKIFSSLQSLVSGRLLVAKTSHCT